jgi:putative transcriptional regulator
MVKVYLSRLLGERRIKQSDLVKMTGIRPNTVSDLYNEVAASINFDNLEAICEALNCDIADVLEYTPRKKVEEENSITSRDFNLTRREAEIMAELSRQIARKVVLQQRAASD